MKPIIIISDVKDGKINMSVSEFKKYIEDAYQQGYKDGGSVTTVPGYGWRDLTPRLNDIIYEYTDSTTNITK